MSKYILEIPHSEWERYIVLLVPSPLPETTSTRVAWWEVKAADFPFLSSIAVFFVHRHRFACHVERAFTLLGHILLGKNFWKIWVPHTYGLKHAMACRRRANFSWGLLSW